MTEGRTYVCYEDQGDTNLPATTQWVDMSPSAINGGDYVYKYGDEVKNFLFVANDNENDTSIPDAVFFAQHYDLGRLDNIASADPSTP